MIPLESAMREKCGKSAGRTGIITWRKTLAACIIVVNNCKVDLCMMHTLLKEKG